MNMPSATIKLSNNESCTLYASQNCNSTVITEVSVIKYKIPSNQKY